MENKYLYEQGTIVYIKDHWTQEELSKFSDPILQNFLQHIQQGEVAQIIQALSDKKYLIDNQKLTQYVVPEEIIQGYITTLPLITVLNYMVENKIKVHKIHFQNTWYTNSKVGFFDDEELFSLSFSTRNLTDTVLVVYNNLTTERIQPTIFTNKLSSVLRELNRRMAQFNKDLLFIQDSAKQIENLVNEQKKLEK